MTPTTTASSTASCPGTTRAWPSLRRRRRGRPLRQLPRARPRRAGPLQPGLRRQAAVRPDRQARAHRRPGVRLLALPARSPGDLWTWSAQALRAGATDISFFGSDDPRFTNRPPLRRACSPSRGRCAARRLPAAPGRPLAARPLRDGERGPGPARPRRRRPLPHERRRDLHDVRAARRARGRRLQLRRRHPPARRAGAPGGREDASGCRAATRSTRAFADPPGRRGCAPAARWS